MPSIVHAFLMPLSLFMREQMNRLNDALEQGEPNVQDALQAVDNMIAELKQSRLRIEEMKSQPCI